jgi:hypothetical protein
MRGVGPDTTDPLVALPGVQIDVVLTHEDQRKNCQNVSNLIGWLRASHTPDDFYEVQSKLIEVLLNIEQRRAECKRAAKRLSAHKPAVVSIMPLPEGRDQDSVEEWLLEAYIFGRLARQMRSVGDALAWTAFGFDRRVILALSRNQSPGPFQVKDGLGYELGHIQRFREDTGQFALLHDITNCLRIADVTEFHADGRCRFSEIKAGNRARSAQTTRAQQAVDALNGGAPLPGPLDAALVPVTAQYVTDVDHLAAALQAAATGGCCGIDLPGGRALVATDMPALAANFTESEGADLITAERTRAVNVADIGGADQHIQGMSFDTAARAPTQAPFGIYPLDPPTVARLICDYIGFTTVVSVDYLADAFRDLGYQVDVPLPEANTQLVGDARVLRIANQRHTLTVYQQSMGQLLYELVKPDAWVAAVAELLEAITPGTTPNPIMVFAGEAATWR